VLHLIVGYLSIAVLTGIVMKPLRFAFPRIVLPLLMLGSYSASDGALAQSPFLGEIRWVAFNFPPRGWALCDGQLLAINQNQALFALLGTTFGGNGTTNFALPNLKARAPIHVGTAYSLGSQAGEATHSLLVSELPAHRHLLKADPQEATSNAAAGNYLAKSSGGTSLYGLTATAPMSPSAISTTGGTQPHENMKPFLALNCIIALQGIFPSRP